MSIDLILNKHPLWIFGCMRTRFCSKPQDIVYGIMGCMPKRLKIQVDYKLDVQTIILDFSIKVLNILNDRQILAFKGNSNTIDGGSWSPGIKHNGFGHVYYNRINDSEIEVTKWGLKFLYPKVLSIEKIIFIGKNRAGLGIKRAYDLITLGLEKNQLLQIHQGPHAKLRESDIQLIKLLVTDINNISEDEANFDVKLDYTILEKKIVLYTRKHLTPTQFGIKHDITCKCIIYKNIFDWCQIFGNLEGEFSYIIVCSNGLIATMIGNGNIDIDKLIYTGMKSIDGSTWLAIKRLKKNFYLRSGYCTMSNEALEQSIEEQEDIIIS